MIYILLYLVAIVAANLSVAMFGASAAIINAFVLISLDLTSRDALHDHWRGRYLWPKMVALIAGGSILSYTLNTSAGRIALASFMAFLCAGLVDALIYSALGERSRLVRMNGSNLFSAAVDSVVFPLIAFSVINWWVILGLFGAKIVGGLVWSLFLPAPRLERAL